MIVKMLQTISVIIYKQKNHIAIANTTMEEMLANEKCDMIRKK